jgi:hypothetical protein
MSAIFAINPLNGRKLKVGGATYNRLVADGTIVEAPESKDDLVDDETKDSQDTKRLIELSSLQATKLYKNISSGKLEIPANIDDDESLSNYLQQSLMLGLLQEKDELIKKMGQPKKVKKGKKVSKVKFERPPSSSDSESSE